MLERMVVESSLMQALSGFDFKSSRMRYRLNANGANNEAGGIKEGEVLPQIDRIRAPRREDVITILRWFANPEVNKHMAPAPKTPEDWENEEDVKKHIDKYADYLNNKGDRAKIMPALAVNSKDEPLAIAVLRWRGDPYVPKEERIASIEGLVVDPKIQGHFIGTEFVSTLIKIALDGYKGYLGSRGAKEIRAWVMTDDKAKPWVRNLGFFTALGFQEIPNHKPWQTYAAERNIELTDDEKTRGDARWLYLTPELYARAEKNNLTVNSKSLIDITLFNSAEI